MLPPVAFSRGRAAAQVRMEPVRLTSTTSAKTSGSISAPRRIIPAQFTSTSSRGRPSMIAPTPAASRTSSRAKVTAGALSRAAATSASVAPGREHRGAQPGEGAGACRPDPRRPAGDQHLPAGEEIGPEGVEDVSG